MTVEDAARSQARRNTDACPARHPGGEQHGDGLTGQIENSHDSAACASEKIHHAPQLQNVGEHKGHHHVRKQAVKPDVESLLEADDKDVEGIVRGGLGGFVTHFRNPSYKRCSEQSG